MELAAPLNVTVEAAVAVKVPAFVKLPPMLRLSFALIVRVPSVIMLRLAQTSPVAATVMVIPAGITTASVARGATPVDQLVPVSQLPDAIAILLAIAVAE